jgi:hypothetical protein
MSFTGTFRIRIFEAKNLRPTDFQKRHNVSFSKLAGKLTLSMYFVQIIYRPQKSAIFMNNFFFFLSDLNPYISMDVDEKLIGEWELYEKCPTTMG